ASRPAGSTRLLREIFAGTPATAEPRPVAVAPPEPRPEPPSVRTDLRPVPRPRTGSGPGPGSLAIGHRYDEGSAVHVPLASLRQHAAIFAGSGSGKTVLIRRIVEECALAGVSSIVLDPNNDLARLGDPWPSPPEGWAKGDADRAHRYLAGTEVLVWTPMVG